MKRTLFKLAAILIIPFLVIGQMIKRAFKRSNQKKLGILNIEYFHEEVGGYGGYGKTAKNIADYFNHDDHEIDVEVIVTRSHAKPEMKFLHNTDVTVAVDSDSSNIGDLIKYLRLLYNRNIDVLMTVEYCTDYLHSILYLPTTPLIIWIHDPRPRECLEKIATCNLELLANRVKAEELIEHDQVIRESLKKVISFSKIFNRKVIFSTTCHLLTERAKKLYDLPDIDPIVLPTPVGLPALPQISFSTKPSFCFLGRWDPIKRPCIFFELAKKFKNVDFFVAGKTHFPELMEPIKKKYDAISNLIFLGHIDGQEKDKLLRNTWAIVNTSIHEALPVSFLESFAYGKPIISCQNPDGFAEKFGEYTGELLGDGYDQTTIDAFSSAIERMLSDGAARMNKGMAARKYVEENYSHKKFESVLRGIIAKL